MCVQPILTNAGALLDAKTQIAEASQVAALYQAAKEELAGSTY